MRYSAVNDFHFSYHPHPFRLSKLIRQKWFFNVRLPFNGALGMPIILHAQIFLKTRSLVRISSILRNVPVFVFLIEHSFPPLSNSRIVPWRTNCLMLQRVDLVFVATYETFICFVFSLFISCTLKIFLSQILKAVNKGKH